MARTRIKGSNIEDHSIKNEDIAISDGLDASKIISGTVLPALDASQLLNTLDSISDNSIPFQKLSDNSIPLSKLSTTNAGTTGQVLIRDDTGEIELVDAHTVISDNSIPLTKLFTANSGTAGQLLKKNASGELEFVDDQVSDVGASTVGGDLSGTVNNAQINDNVINISNLDVSDGTPGQLLQTDGSGNLSFTTVDVSGQAVGGDLEGTVSYAWVRDQHITTAKIAYDAIDISRLNVPNNGTNGQALVTDGSNGLSWADVTADPVMGGQLSGLASNAQITAVDASKIFGTLPHGIASGGALGYLNIPDWADDFKRTVNLSHSADDIGKIVVKVYEEHDGSFNLNKTNTNWTLTNNEEGFQVFNYLTPDATVTPSATTGKDVTFTFANFYNGFTAGGGSDGLGYRIINKNGTGKAVITASDGLTATCDILEDFPNTDTLPAGTFTLEGGIFENNSWTLGTYPFKELKGMWNERTDQSAAASSQAGITMVNPQRHEVVTVDETRALVGYVRDAGSKYGVRMMKVVDRPAGTQITEYVQEAWKSHYSYPILHSGDGFNNISGKLYGDISVCHMTSTAAQPHTDRALFAGARTDGSNYGFCIHVLNLPPTGSSSQDITMPNAEQWVQTPGAVDNIEIKRLTNNHFMVITRENRTFSPSGNGFCPVAYMGYVDWNAGQVTISGSGTGQLLMTDQLSMYGSISGFNHPIAHIFGTEHIADGEFGLGYFFNNGDKPEAFYCRVTNFDPTSNTPNGTIGYILTTLKASQGNFRNSSGAYVTGGRLDDGDTYGTCAHTISRIDDLRALWVWGDSNTGIDAAIVSLAPEQTKTKIADIDFNISTYPMFVGEYPSKLSTNIYPEGQSPTPLAGTKQVAATVIDNDTAFCTFRYGSQASNNSGIKVGTFKFNSTGASATALTSIGGGEAPFWFNVNISTPINDDSTQFWPIRAVALTDNNRIITTEWFDAGNVEIGARLWHKESQVYSVNQWETIISSIDSVNTQNISDINSMTATGNAYANTRQDYTAFCFSTDITQDANGNVIGGTYFIRQASEGTYRNIITNRNSVHGLTEGIWACNTSSNYNSESWTMLGAGTTHTSVPSGQPGSSTLADLQQWNSPVAAFRVALSGGGYNQNRMEMGDVNAIGDNEFFTLGDKLSVGMGVKTNLTTKTTGIDGITINYDSGAVHRDKTHEYTIDIVDVDTIEVTSPNGGGPRNARIYVTS
tara:strand:- start:104 stop:3742 length:3639 start_codon:yes stop_codon:yes gene_type:complete